MNQQEFREWVSSHWDGHRRVRPGHEELAIMGLGLGGETGEVYAETDAIAFAAKQNHTALKLELGDVLHYATAIGVKFNVPFDASTQSIPLVIAMGNVLEPVKKFIRDGKDPVPKLTEALPQVLGALERIAIITGGWSLDEVRAANVEKLLERYAAGRFKDGVAVQGEPLKVAA